ncbi:DUF5615 family PIN-like protein [Deferrisoma camini]|uniref:DUF5615 family PIN-like protein n=1 Tax=Deferrisoma camini TaxID=1035120 RepID=UPI00146AE173
MRILADECIDASTVSAFRAAGWEVTYVAEVAPGSPDGEVLDMAKRLKALLLTADKDFGEIVFRRREAPYGVLLVRLPGMDPNERARLAVRVVTRHADELFGNFSVLTGASLRVRRPFR